MNNKDLGRLLRLERTAKRLTQKELGELSGVGINFVSQLERGKTTVRLDKLLDVLRVLGLELCLQRGKSGLSAVEELSR